MVPITEISETLKNMTKENGDKILNKIKEYLKDFTNEFIGIDTEKLL